ncbi:unnamed protein product [Protopolystoma xenopodis]|uniref:Uncharacterized protein n=1 Tax=Protopolystoma xenopodis TaxID=117903 RepID=A0A448WYU9_9PLAT|nr:unnamed protein product [Protopolystoma xenopodis]
MAQTPAAPPTPLGSDLAPSNIAICPTSSSPSEVADSPSCAPEPLTSTASSFPSAVSLSANNPHVVPPASEGQSRKPSSRRISKSVETAPPQPLSLDPIFAGAAGGPLWKRSVSDNRDERLDTNANQFVLMPDNRTLIACGYCDNSFRIFSVETGTFTTD